MDIWLNKRKITSVDVQMMDLNEINSLIFECQTEIHRLVNEKLKLTTLPGKLKNTKTIAMVRELTSNIMHVQDFVNYVSVIKKQKRDNQLKERDWYRKFYEMTKLNIRDGLFEKIEKQTEKEIGFVRVF